MAVAAQARALPGAAVLLLLSLQAICVRPARPPPAAVGTAGVLSKSRWVKLVEETGSSAQTHWLLPTSKSPTVELPGGLPEYYGATVHRVIHPECNNTAVMATLRAAMALRNNMVSVFGYFLHQPENHLGEELYPALNLIQRLVRLRRIPVVQLVPVVPQMADVSSRNQFLILFRRMVQVVPAYARGAVQVWIEALENNKVDVEAIMRPHKGPLIVDFLAGFDRMAVKRLTKEDMKLIEDLNSPSAGKDKFILHVLNNLQNGKIRFTQPMFGLILSLRHRNTILPGREESEKHLIDTLIHNKFIGWDRVSWSFKKDHVKSPHNFIHSVLSTLIIHSDLEAKDQLRKVIEYNEIPKSTFSHKFFEQLSTILSKPSLDVLKLLEVIVLGKYPDEIVDLRWRIEHYLRNGLLDVENALRGFNRFDYATPQDILVAIFTRIQKYLSNLPYEIISSINHLKHYMQFKMSREKLLPIRNAEVIDMLNEFQSYHVPDKVIEASLKLKAQLQLENIDWTQVLRNVNADNCGQPRTCIRSLFKEALDSQLLNGLKCKSSIEDFLLLLKEDGDPINLWEIPDSIHQDGRNEISPKGNGKDCKGENCNSHSDQKPKNKKIKNTPKRNQNKQTEANSSKRKSRKPTSTHPAGKPRKNTGRSTSSESRLNGVENNSRSEKDEIGKSHLSSSTAFPDVSVELNAKRLRSSDSSRNIADLYTMSRSLASLSPNSGENDKVNSFSNSEKESSIVINPMNTPQEFARESSTETPLINSHNLNREVNVQDDASTIQRTKRNVEINIMNETIRLLDTPESDSDIEISTQNTVGERRVFITSTYNQRSTAIPGNEARNSITVPPNINDIKFYTTEENLRNNATSPEKIDENLPPGRYKIVTKEWTKKKHKKHRRLKHGIRPIGYRPPQHSDENNSVGFESDPSEHVYYRPSQMFYGLRPVRYRLIKVKRYKKHRRRRVRHHRPGEHDILSNLTDKQSLRRELTGQGYQPVLEDSFDYDHPSGEYLDNDNHTSEDSCGEGSGDDQNCHSSHESLESENLSTEDYSHEGSGADQENSAYGSRSEDDSHNGSRDSSERSLMGAFRNTVMYGGTSYGGFPTSVEILPSYLKRGRGRYKMLTRERLQRTRKRRRHHSPGLGPVGFAPISSSEVHDDYSIIDSPIPTMGIPIMYGQVPVSYRLVKTRRKTVFRRRRRRRKNARDKNISNIVIRRGGLKSIEDEIEMDNDARRGIPRMRYPEETDDYNHYEPNDDYYDNYDNYYDECNESSENYPECATNQSEFYDDDEDYGVRSVGYESAERNREMGSHEREYDEDPDNSEDFDYYRELLPIVDFRSGFMDERWDSSKDWERRIQHGWKPPKFTSNCPNKGKDKYSICKMNYRERPTIYKGHSETKWEGNWTYPPDLIHVALTKHEDPKKLLTLVRELQLHNSNKSFVRMSLDQATLVEVLFEALTEEYEREAEKNIPDERFSAETTATGTAVIRRPTITGFLGTEKSLRLDITTIHHLLEGSSSAELPVPEESAELEPANAARLDTLLPVTVPGTLTDVKMRPLRIFLAIPEAHELLNGGGNGAFRPDWSSRKGPLLREVLTRLGKSKWVARHPMLKKAAEDLLKTWKNRRRRRPHASVELSSLADALPGAAGGGEDPLGAARAFLATADAAAALSGGGGADATKAQVLRKVLQRAAAQLRDKDAGLAGKLLKASQNIVPDGLGAQAPARILPAAASTTGAISIDVRALFRNGLNSQRVLNDRRAAAALKELLRSGTARGFDARGVFRSFDASRHRTRAQLLTGVLGHLGKAGPSKRVREAARLLLPLVVEKGEALGVQVHEGIPGHHVDWVVKAVAPLRPATKSGTRGKKTKGKGRRKKNKKQDSAPGTGVKD